MRVYFQYWIMGGLMFACLWPLKEEDSEQLLLSNPPFFCTKHFIDSLRIKQPDTLVHLSVFNFNHNAVKIPLKDKRAIINTIVSRLLPKIKYFYISEDGQYWKRDTANHDFVSVNCSTCQFGDFYFIDLDKDGDLDIIYSSLVNDYLNDDSNETLFFRNNNGRYEKFGLNGFVRNVEFKKSKDYIVFKMASLGCCDDNNYQLYNDTLHTKSWKFSSGNHIRLRNNEVVLHYPLKDCL